MCESFPRLLSSSRRSLCPLSSFVGSVDACAKDHGGKKLSKSEVKPMAPKPDGNLKVFVYEKSGGFIGVDLKYEKELSELGSDERKTVGKN